ncbi:hypothetical protein O181_009273 [Austropuccinia psidii MF-1]|uniref:Reverse transcriptase domain-containing protein n=1 Tax=Austropuccinia psidii MF-1 TaxID=1389203 RepID=A0A9Q3BR17_9BASI|nr:hypothetical protein [Austropuccinia psidii MF-1]
MLQDLMDVTLELDTRYHERQKEKIHHQEKKPEASKLNSSHPQNSSSSSQKKKKNFQKRDKPHSSFLNKDFKLMNYEKERRIKEVLCNYCGGNHSLEYYFKRSPNKLDVFSKVKSEKLPPHCACDHHIELEGSLPPVGVIYSLSNQESDTLRAYISKNVEKGFIRPSSSSTGAPVLFVKKKDGSLCLCVDYHKIFAVTRKNKYPVPPMNHLLNVSNGSSIFSKIVLRGAYNRLRIKEGDEHLTAFRTKYGSYEYLVIPFGLTSAPASFQNLVNDILQDLLDVFVVAYLDDIMVFYKSKEEHDLQ